MADPLPTPDSADREAGLEAALVLILQAEDAGRPQDPDHWLARFPEHRAELLQYFTDQAAVAAAAGARPPGPLPEFPGHEVIRELGRGGMGVVYEARQLDPPRVVALKALSTARLRTPVERVRFRRESRVAARLDHSGIVPVYTIGEADGVPFYTMRLAPGGPLSRVLHQYQADPRAAARLVADLARAVHHAHQHAVLHRDLKPSNILLDADGRGCVADFGLVRDLADPDPLTGTADLVGTPAYMAPEQTRGTAVPCTVATDVYGLGCVLYECLTGRPPFAGANPAAILLQVQQAEPDRPARLNPRVPRDLDAVCRICLEKDPARRYPSAAELAADLGRFLRGVPVRAKPVGPVQRAWRWVKRNPVAAALWSVTTMAVLLATGTGIWHWDRERLHRIELKVAEDEKDRHRFFAGLEQVRQRRDDPYAPWSRQSLADLRELAALSPARDYLHDLRSEAAAALAALDPKPGPLLADFPAYAGHYSADGRWLAVAGWVADAAGQVELTDLRTGARRRLAFPRDADWAARTGKADGARSVRFSPAGDYLVVGTRSGRLARWDLRDPAAGPAVWPAHAADDPDPTRNAVHYLGFTADGGTVLSGAGSGTRGWNPADGRPTGLWLPQEVLPTDFYPVRTEIAVHAPAVRMMECRRYLIEGGRATLVGRFDGWRPLCLGPTEGLAAYHPDDASGLHLGHVGSDYRSRPLEEWEEGSFADHLAFGPAGDLLAATFEHGRRVRVWDVPSGQLVADRTTAGDVTRVAFHPGGRHLVVSGSDGARRYDLPDRALETVAVVADPDVRAVTAPADHSRLRILTRRSSHYNSHCYPYVLPATGPAVAVPGGTQIDSMHHPEAVADTSPDGSRWVFAGHFREAFVQDETGARLSVGRLHDVRFGPDNRLWVLEDHLLRTGFAAGEAPIVWTNDAVARDAVRYFQCLAPGRGYTLIGRRDGRVFRVAADGGQTGSWPVLDGPVLALAVSPDERRAVAGGQRGELRLLDLASGAVTDLPEAHRADVTSVAHGPRLVVTGSADRRVRLWTPAGEPIATLTMRGPVARVLLSADESSLLVHVRGERAVRRWRLDVLSREWDALGLDAKPPAP